MIEITYPEIKGCVFVQIITDTLEEAQEAITRYHGRAVLQGPEKFGDKYKAWGMMGQ